MKLNNHITLYIVCLLLFQQCSDAEKSHKEDAEHLHHLIDKITQANNDLITYRVSSLDHIGDIELVKVETPSGEEFMIPDRISQIESYSCLNCHDRSIQKLAKARLNDYKKSHWNITLRHAPDETMNCFTCHDSNNLNQLTSITGQTISLNQSYNLCGQCHSQQKKDWHGGAHGKRIGGWAPPRVSMTCVNCHNPHDPSFKPRWPSRLNKTKILQQENQ